MKKQENMIHYQEKKKKSIETLTDADVGINKKLNKDFINKYI